MPPLALALNSPWIFSSTPTTLVTSAGWFQSFCGASRMRAPLAPPPCLSR
ncbi:MAG: hypothetical protein R3B72_46215 [Polyangiaceae bacterium]